MESSIEPPAGGNITTKGLADVVNTFLTVAENLVTTGAPNLGEVGSLWRATCLGWVHFRLPVAQQCFNST